MSTAPIFGRRLKQARKDAGLTQTQLAELMGGRVTQRDVSRWEQGKHMPSGEHQWQLVQALDRAPSALGLGGTLLTDDGSAPRD